MMNKTGRVTLIAFLIFLSLGCIAIAETTYFTKNIAVTYRGIQVFVEGKKIAGEEPFILNKSGTVMVPVRTVSEAIGKSVLWDPKKNIVYIGTGNVTGQKTQSTASVTKPKQGSVIPVTYRGIQIYAGGKILKSEEPFILDNQGIVMVPIRAVSEATGKSVIWEAKTNSIKISAGLVGSTPPKANNFAWLEDMTVIRNVGPFFRQGDTPFSIATGTHNRGLGVRLTEGSAEVVIRTHGKYKAIEGWLGVDDETKNSSGAFFFSIFTDNKSVPSNVEAQGGAGKIILETPDEYGYDYTLTDSGIIIEDEDDEDEDDEDKKEYYEEEGFDINVTKYPVNSDFYEKKPVFLSGPILPASYPKYISPAVTDISGALTVTLKITWVAGEEGDYPDLTAVLANFKFIKE